MPAADSLVGQRHTRRIRRIDGEGYEVRRRRQLDVGPIAFGHVIDDDFGPVAIGPVQRDPQVPTDFDRARRVLPWLEVAQISPCAATVGTGEDSGAGDTGHHLTAHESNGPDTDLIHRAIAALPSRDLLEGSLHPGGARVERLPETFTRGAEDHVVRIAGIDRETLAADAEALVATDEPALRGDAPRVAAVVADENAPATRELVGRARIAVVAERQIYAHAV